ncbi:Hsp20/alpha crystallin family protein [Patescibacteria group bacterium]
MTNLNTKTTTADAKVISPTILDTDLENTEELEGQLTIDMFQTETTVVVKSTIAGVLPEDISVTLDDNMLTIRGERAIEEKVDEKDYFYQECYWGSFSRSVALPVEVDANKVKAEIKNGILIVKLPKIKIAKPKQIKVTG